MTTEITYPFQDCRYEINDGLVTLLFKDPKPSFIDKIFFKKRLEKDIKLDLDEIGSFVWNLCDGKNNINDIAVKCVEKYSEKAEPAFDRVILFVNQLKTNGFLKLYEKR